MFKILFVLFLAVPLIELYLLIKVGSLIGALPTVVCVILTAVLGAGLVRVQGLSNWYRLQARLNSGELPAEELVTGVLLFAAGVLLLIPGFVTDTAGFLLLLPPLRRALWRRFAAHHIWPAAGYGGRPGGVTIHVNGRDEGSEAERRPIEHDQGRRDD